MYMYDEITWEQFTLRFREVVGREMAPDEHRWFHSDLDNREQKKKKGAAPDPFFLVRVLFACS